MLLVLSCISFNIFDYPSEYVWPHNTPTANWCGSAGSFCAYYLLYYVGPGVFVFLGAMSWLLATNMFGAELNQLILRTAGMLLLVITLSTTVYMVHPYSESGFVNGNGGIIGIGAGSFLVGQIKPLGTWVVLVCAWAVGLILLADTIVLTIVRGIGVAIGKVLGFTMPAWASAREHSQALGDIWARLSIKQKKKAWYDRKDLEDDDNAIEEEVADDDEYEYEYEYEEEEEEVEPARKKKKKEKEAPKPRT